MKILCVEDDESFARLLQRSLSKQHYQVELATDGQSGWELIETFSYDLILLDWMLPNLTGIEVCQRLRAGTDSTHNPNQDTPILLMTALDTITNKVMGFNAGADDYVVKPFDLDELSARIRALLRRSKGVRSPLLHWGHLCLNPNSCEVTYHNQPILLPPKEYELLELFLRNPNQIFSVDRLLSNLWTSEDIPSEGAVRAHIKGLRQKLKQAGSDDPIETLYKLGYRLKQWKESDEPDPPKNQTIEPVFSPHTSVSPPLPAAATPLVLAELWGVWQECHQSYCDRLLIIQNTVTSLQQGTLTPAQQQEAEREAHTLIGSLGSFGLEQASHIARQIQQILKQPTPLEQADVEQLLILISQLRHHLENAKTKQPQQTEAAKQLENLKQLEKTEKLEQPEPNQPELNQPFSPLTPASPLPTLLIVDDDLSLAQILAKEALSWGWQAKIATRLYDAQHILQHHDVNIILLDLNFSDSAGNGLNFLAAVRRQSPEIPVVMLTAEETFEKRVEAARLGSRCFLQKPIAPAQVLATITQVLYQTSQSVAHILVVDDDPALLAMLCSLLEPCGYEVTGLSDPRQFWQTLEQSAPDLLILDVELGEPAATKATTFPPTPTLSGIELCQVIRSDPRWNRVPVLFLSAHTDIETVQRGFAVGADDFLSKPVAAQELLTRVQTRLEQRKLWQITDLDELTGVSLRRKAIPDLTRLIRLAQRQQRPFSLAVLDLDHFKQVNDRYGHAAGDHVLSYLGKLLHQSFRQEDIVGRWGGEEFIIGMYGITKQDGIKRLEEVLQQLNQYVFLAQNGMSFQVTFSAGIAQLTEDGNDLQTLYHHADQALYQAKSAGRNQILATPSFTPPPSPSR